jgi:hypothetical protein
MSTTTTPTPLILTDPLAAQPVTIMITLPVAESPRDERPALVSIGSDGRSPVFRQGVLADVAALIDEAWTAFGVREELLAAQARAALAGASETAEPETIATAAVGSEGAGSEAGQPLPPAPAVKAVPRPPKPKNLSLF